MCVVRPEGEFRVVCVRAKERGGETEREREGWREEEKRGGYGGSNCTLLRCSLISSGLSSRLPLSPTKELFLSVEVCACCSGVCVSVRAVQVCVCVLCVCVRACCVCVCACCGPHLNT